MKKYLEYKDEKSHKFWQIEVESNTFTVRFGKINSKGQTRVSDFETKERALSQAKKMVEKKLAKGYKEIKEEIEDSSNQSLGMLANFKKKFAPYTLPNTLVELIKFDDSLEGNSYYSQSFYLNDDIEEDFFETWLDNDSTDKEKRKEYAKNMLVFANADGTGGSYAMWVQKGNTDLEKAPIITYGSEGEIQVVAENLRDLLKMLSFGAEGMDGSFYHYFDDDEYEEDPTYFYKEFVEARPNFLKFRKWMKTILNIEPVDIDCLKKGACDESEEIEKLIKKAQKKYTKIFDKWQYQYYPNPEEESKKYQEKQDFLYETTKAKLLAKIAKIPTVKDYLALAKNENLPEKVNHEQKETYFEKALALEPKNIEVLEALAKANRYTNPKKAIEYYLKLIEVSDKSEAYYSDMAYVYESAKSYTKALKFYEKDIIANPKSYGDYSQKYIVDICKKLKSKKAISILEDTLKYGENATTSKVLYNLYFKKKKYTKASEYAVQYIEHSDEQAHNYMTIYERFLKKELHKEALPILEKTINRHDWDSRKMQTYNNIGLCHLRIPPQNIDKALEAFKKAYLLEKEEKVIHQNINLCGTKYLENKVYDKAIDAFEYCVANNLAKDMALFNIGVCYVVQKEYKTALPYYEKALKLNPNNDKYKQSVKTIKQQLKADDKGFLGKLFGKKK